MLEAVIDKYQNVSNLTGFKFISYPHMSTVRYLWVAFHVMIQEPRLPCLPFPGVLESFTSSHAWGKTIDSYPWDNFMGLEGMLTSTHFTLGRAQPHGHIYC